MVDRELNKAASLRKTVDGVWSDLVEPVLINKNPAPVWIRFFCRDIKGDISLQKSGIVCFASIKAKMLIVTDTTAYAKHKILPDFKQMTAKEKQPESDIFIYGNTSFHEINTQLNELLKGKEISSGGYNITIKAIRAYASTEGLTIAVESRGDLNGRFFLNGRPFFDVTTKRLIVRDFDFALHTSSVIVNRGDDVLHERVASKLNPGLDMLTGRLPVIINHAIAKEKTGRTIDIRVGKLAIKQCDILMGKEKIHFIINAGKASTIKPKKLKPGKLLMIGLELKKTASGGNERCAMRGLNR